MTNIFFQFLDPGPLVDKDLELKLVDKKPGDPATGIVPAYVFEMRHPGHIMGFGKIDLRVGHTPLLDQIGGQMGYDVDPLYRGHRYAARSIKLLLPLARRHGLQTVWITCNPDNIASRRSAERAGARFVEIVDVPASHELYRKGDRQKCRYRIDL
jgi:tagatose 1,6-diphosphate aldolase